MAKKRSGGKAPPAELAEYRRKRDFGRTPEPEGRGGTSRRPRRLQFVIQKHAASHLHFDLRLELDGVMKSWAVPKGPSADPAMKRLAMQVEDHPMDYNTFEGTIPAGEYGGGTVMLWDRGHYTADEAGAGDDHGAVLRRELRAGKMSVTFHGERMQGSWALVRTDPGPRPKWLFIKHRDGYARSRPDLVEQHRTSVHSGRTMEEIAAERDRVWRSNRAGSPGGEEAGQGPAPLASDTIRPMRAQPARRLPQDTRVYQAWHGGERVLALATPDACALLDERGRNLAAKYPDIADALQALARRAKSTFVLDGEVAEEGRAPVLHALDILLHGGDALTERAWHDRHAELEQLFRRRRVPGVKLAATAEDATALLAHADRDGLSGVYAWRPDAKYRPGKRTDDLVRVATPARFRSR